jgi:hypothetical protein
MYPVHHADLTKRAKALATRLQVQYVDALACPLKAQPCATHSLVCDRDTAVGGLSRVLLSLHWAADLQCDIGPQCSVCLTLSVASWFLAATAACTAWRLQAAIVPHMGPEDVAVRPPSASDHIHWAYPYHTCEVIKLLTMEVQCCSQLEALSAASVRKLYMSTLTLNI